MSILTMRRILSEIRHLKQDYYYRKAKYPEYITMHPEALADLKKYFSEYRNLTIPNNTICGLKIKLDPSREKYHFTVYSLRHIFKYVINGRTAEEVRKAIIQDLNLQPIEEKEIENIIGCSCPEHKEQEAVDLLEEIEDHLQQEVDRGEVNMDQLKYLIKLIKRFK